MSEEVEQEFPLPGMNFKTVKHFKRPLLIAGALLLGLVTLETGQEMVKALELTITAAEEQALPDLADYQSWETTSENESTGQQPALGSGSSASESFGLNANTTPNRQLLAINAGEANDPQQPVSQDVPAQVAASDWYGASFPVENFQAYTSPFGYRQAPDGGYSTEFHYGLDMAAPEGSYIRNWWGGKIVEVSDDSNCGTSVVVESGPWMHIYCHMRGHVEEDSRGRYMIDREGGIQIWEGQDLSAGARIGRVGMTGRTTGPHLHWGLKYSENWVDPALVLRAMYSTQRAASANQSQ
ncbi:MAG: hypothetical protein Kow00121_52780 [Elainellaceae cyanobacterium]